MNLKRWVPSPPESKWPTAALLCFVNLINYMDRYTISGVLPDIQEEFEISDAGKAGFIQTAFVIMYAVGAPSFGYWGDRYSRKWLMIGGMVAWTTCILTATFMPEYYSFTAMRALMGFGEAGFTSIAPTVLGDLYSPEDRTVILALFYYAIPVGSGLGYMVSSVVAYYTGDWRWGLRIAPFLNMAAIVLMVFFCSDPPRGGSDFEDKGKEAEVQVKNTATWSAYAEDLKYLIMNKTFMMITVGFTALTFFTGSLAFWAPSFIEDALVVGNVTDGTDPPIAQESVSFWFGLIVGFGGFIGLTLGSALSYFLRPRIRWVDPVICGVGVLLSVPLTLPAIGMAKDDVVLAFVLIFVGQIFLNMNWAIIVDVSLYVVVPSRRATAEAFQLLAAHAIGEAGAPYLVGLMADAFEEGMDYGYTEEYEYWAMQYAFFICTGFLIVGGIIFLLGACFVVADKQKVDDFYEELGDGVTENGLHAKDYEALGVQKTAIVAGDLTQ